MYLGLQQFFLAFIGFHFSKFRSYSRQYFVILAFTKRFKISILVRNFVESLILLTLLISQFYLSESNHKKLPKISGSREHVKKIPFLAEKFAKGPSARNPQKEWKSTL